MGKRTVVTEGKWQGAADILGLCMNEDTRSYAARKQAEYRKTRGRWAYQKIAINRFVMDLMRAVPCTDCGGRYPAICMDFDHLPEHEKTTEVSVLATHNYWPSRVVAEMAKCEVVCSNCHRLRTKGRRV